MLSYLLIWAGFSLVCYLFWVYYYSMPFAWSTHAGWLANSSEFHLFGIAFGNLFDIDLAGFAGYKNSRWLDELWHYIDCWTCKE